MKKDSDNQLFFDFDAPVEPQISSAEVAEEPVNPIVEEAAEVVSKQENAPAPAVAAVSGRKSNPEQLLYQAVLAQLVKNGATGAALHVPCRHYKFKAAVAAYFSDSSRKFNLLESCVLVDIYSQRNQCIPECAGSQAVAAELIELRRQRQLMEEQIKLDEPELRAEDELFDEFRSFNFANSSNKAYHKLCRRIASLQQSLYKGTRMEQLSRSAVADYLIIAVPENLISQDELPEGWGLWYIMPDGSIQQIKSPERQSCSEISRWHLVQNIGRCALQNVLFAQGIKINKDNSVRFTRTPRARRK